MTYQSSLVKTDITTYLKQHENKQLLRLLTCGSVDDGKSTLIGRLLHDSKMIYEDQLAAVTADSAKSGTTGEKVDLALLVDGLQAEREQGITIDVAYRYFSTTKRKFIIADTPGHEQYTRNMVTGASTSDLAIILIDAREGVKTQTKRHSYIASLLGIKHIVVAINKMDLVNYDEDVFIKICSDFKEFSTGLNLPDIHFIPMSALEGDNVVHSSELMPWFTESPLMDLLENIEISVDKNVSDMRFPVQYVNRPNLDFRGYSGSVTSGKVSVGKEVIVYPSMVKSKVSSIVTYDGEIDHAYPPMAVTVTLADELDISRGDVILYPDNLPVFSRQLSATVVWMSEEPMELSKQYDFKHSTQSITGHVSAFDKLININDLTSSEGHLSLDLNEIGVCQIRLNNELAFDPYINNKGFGSFIIIDRLTNATVGCGMVMDRIETTQEIIEPVDAKELKARFGHHAGVCVIDTSLDSNESNLLKRQLFNLGIHSVILPPAKSFTNQLDLPLIIESIAGDGLICVTDYPYKNSSLLVVPINKKIVVDLNALEQSFNAFK